MPESGTVSAPEKDVPEEGVPTSYQPATSADVELGRAGLLEITSAESIGEPLGSIDEGDGAVTVYFETLLSGYPGWRWTVSIAHVDGGPGTVLETELTPSDGALLSPEWVPWIDRLADHQAEQDALESAARANDDDDDSEDDDDSDGDDPDDDDPDDGDDSDREDLDDGLDDGDEDLSSDVLHSGDVDGVDIDDDSDDDLSDEDEDDDDDDDERDRSF